MNRRTFFATIAAACGIEIIGKIQVHMREQEVAAILRLRDDLSVAIRKANEQLREINKRQHWRIKFIGTNKQPIQLGEVMKQ